MLASAYGPPAVVSALLKAGATTHGRNSVGYSSLHYAAKYNRHKVVSLLLEAKSEVNCENHHGLTPLLFAARYGNANMVAELLKFRADIHMKNSGYDVHSLAKLNREDSKNVLAVLRGITDL